MPVFVYVLILGLWSAFIAYVLIFKVFPALTRGGKEEEHAPTPPAPQVAAPPPPRPRRAYSAHEGFASVAKGRELTVEDIVTALSREQR
jgi:hypothetical protein